MSCTPFSYRTREGGAFSRGPKKRQEKRHKQVFLVLVTHAKSSFREFLFCCCVCAWISDTFFVVVVFLLSFLLLLIVGLIFMSTLYHLWILS